MELDENYTEYLKEYNDLTKRNPPDWESQHRLKILRERLDNELDKWKNRHD